MESLQRQHRLSSASPRPSGKKRMSVHGRAGLRAYSNDCIKTHDFGVGRYLSENAWFHLLESLLFYIRNGNAVSTAAEFRLSGS